MFWIVTQYSNLPKKLFKMIKCVIKEVLSELQENGLAKLPDFIQHIHFFPFLWWVRPKSVKATTKRRPDPTLLITQHASACDRHSATIKRGGRQATPGTSPAVSSLVRWRSCSHRPLSGAILCYTNAQHSLHKPVMSSAEFSTSLLITFSLLIKEDQIRIKLRSNYLGHWPNTWWIPTHLSSICLNNDQWFGKVCSFDLQTSLLLLSHITA